MALAALAAGCATVSEAPLPPEVDIVRLGLDEVDRRRSELDGRWLEFDAFVYRATPGRSLLVAVPGRTETAADGSSRTLCRGTPETNLPVVLRGGLGPLPEEALRTADRQPRIRIRAVFRNAVFTLPDHFVSLEWPGYVDQATIVGVHDEWCDLH